MSDDHNIESPHERNDIGGQPPRRSGMPPITGDRIERSRDPYAEKLAATQPERLARSERGLPSRQLQIAAVVAAVALSILVPLLTRDSNAPARGSSNNEAIVDRLSPELLCEGTLLAALEAQASRTTTGDDAVPPPGTSLNRFCDDLNDDGTLNGSTPSDEE